MLVCCHFGSVNRITPVFQVVFFRLENQKKRKRNKILVARRHGCNSIEPLAEPVMSEEFSPIKVSQFLLRVRVLTRFGKKNHTGDSPPGCLSHRDQTRHPAAPPGTKLPAIPPRQLRLNHRGLPLRLGLIRGLDFPDDGRRIAKIHPVAE